MLRTDLLSNNSSYRSRLILRVLQSVSIALRTPVRDVHTQVYTFSYLGTGWKGLCLASLCCGVVESLK